MGCHGIVGMVLFVAMLLFVGMVLFVAMLLFVGMVLLVGMVLFVGMILFEGMVYIIPPSTNIQVTHRTWCDNALQDLVEQNCNSEER